MQTFTESYIAGMVRVLEELDATKIEALAQKMSQLRSRGGRLFLIGVGGSAAACSHAVCDFRKLCNIDAYALDNMPLFTAYANDYGLEWTFREWLTHSNLSEKDMLMVISVGGGDPAIPVSLNVVKGIDVATTFGAFIAAIVGRDGGYARLNADICIMVPVVEPELVTYYTESVQAVLLHLLAARLQKNKPKWEGMA